MSVGRYAAGLLHEGALLHLAVEWRAWVLHSYCSSAVCASTTTPAHCPLEHHRLENDTALGMGYDALAPVLISRQQLPAAAAVPQATASGLLPHTHTCSCSHSCMSLSTGQWLKRRSASQAYPFVSCSAASCSSSTWPSHCGAVQVSQRSFSVLRRLAGLHVKAAASRLARKVSARPRSRSDKRLAKQALATALGSALGEDGSTLC